MKRSKFTEEQITYALRQLREENARLKRLVADLTLDKQILTDVVKKSFEAGETSETGALGGQSLSGQRTESLRVRVVFPCRMVPEEPGSGSGGTPAADP